MSHDLSAQLVQRLTRDFGVGAGTARTVIGIAGESGSGKSTTAEQLVHALTASGTPAGLINQDNYFLLPPRTNHASRVADLNRVGPHEVNLALIDAHIGAFRRGEPAVTGPVVNYPANRFDEQTLSFAELRVLVVEGTYVLHCDALDVRIFLEATHRDTHERRMARARDLHEPIIDTILGIEHDIIARQAGRADLLIDRDFHVRPRVHRA